MEDAEGEEAGTDGGAGSRNEKDSYFPLSHTYPKEHSPER